MAQNIKFTGLIRRVRGQVVEVEYSGSGNLPKLRELLTSPDNPKVHLEIFAYTQDQSLLALSLTQKSWLQRNMPITTTNSTLTVPVGDGVLGRVINLFGEPQDDAGELKSEGRRPIYEPATTKITTPTKVELLETGIKPIDFFTPFIKGGKIGFVGGAGVGKTVLMTELLRNVIKQTKGVAIFCGIGERIREGHELWLMLRQFDALSRTGLIFGQMNENAAVRFRTAWAAAALAEYYRDEQKKDILFFVDNVFRFVQAGSELSPMLDQIPSELGYQATLESEVAAFEERLVNTPTGSITSVQNIYVPADELSDPGVAAIMSHLDSVVILSRDLTQRGYYPPIDLFRSSSGLLSSEILGERHFKAVTSALELIGEYERLQRIVSIVGESELQAEDRLIFQRANKLINYMTQPFYTTEFQTNRSGITVPKEDTISDVEKILGGELDKIDADKLLYIGNLSKIINNNSTGGTGPSGSSDLVELKEPTPPPTPPPAPAPEPKGLKKFLKKVRNK